MRRRGRGRRLGGSRPRIVPCWLPPAADRDSLIDPAPRPACDEVAKWVERAEAQIEAGLEKHGSRSSTEIAFFGGSIADVPPALRAELLEAAGKHVRARRASSVRVTLAPGDVEPALLEALWAARVRTVELEAGSFDDDALAASGLAHRAADVAPSVERLRSAKLRTGLVLRPGLPGSVPGEPLRSARRALELGPDFVRVYPVLVLAGSRLEALYESRRYRPLTLDEGIALCRDLLMLFEEGGVPVVRMGFQPAVDLDGGATVVAGPYHPALRAIVEASLMFDRLSKLIADNFRFQKELTLIAHPRDESRVRGIQGANLKRLREKFRFEKLHLKLDESAEPGSIALELEPAPSEPAVRKSG